MKKAGAGKKILRKAAQIKRDLLYRLTGTISISGDGAGEVRVLVYHGVVQTSALQFNSRIMPAELFEGHLRLLSQQCKVLTFDDFITGNIAADRLNVLLTFDDGYKNNFTCAFPLLKKYNLPAIFFVTPRSEKDWLFNDVLDVFSTIGPPEIEINRKVFLKGNNIYHDRYYDKKGNTISEVFHSLEERERIKVLEQVFLITPKEKFGLAKAHLDLMSEHDVKKIASTPGYTIGAHGSSHTDLSLISHEERTRELHHVQSQLTAILGKTCSCLAFPYGKYNLSVIEAGVRAGFEHFFGTEHQSGYRDNVIPRLTVNPYVSAINEYYYISQGSHE